MPRDYSNTRCNNCRAYGHLKKACPLRETVHREFNAVRNKEQNKPSTFHKKTQESSNKETSNSSPTVAYCFGVKSVQMVNTSDNSVKTESMQSNGGKKKNFTSGNQNTAKKYASGKDSDSDHSSNSNYCDICDSHEHDDVDCSIREEMMAFNYRCGYCDKTGHFEHNCPTFLKAAKKQDNDDKKWRQKWGRKIQENKKKLQSTSKPSKSGMQCQHCYSIHHDTNFCFLSPYGIKEDLKI